MRTTRRLINGETLVLDVPDAETMPPATAISVLAQDGLELEVNSGGSDHLEHYLAVSGSTLTGEIQLRNGVTLRHGRYGGDPAQGMAFSVRVGDHEIFGFTVPTLDLEGLSALLSQVEFTAHADGAVLTPGGSVTWSDYRTHDVAQVVHLAQGRRALLDVRRTRTGVTRPSGPGLDVRGGRLSRSAEDERAHYAVLEAAAFVVYGIPGTAEDVDALATSLSQVTAELA
ncbi:hypothetical protein [Ornithinimicrobium cryptoxanthini]|uniref:FHA domain-containing protein n=1 Tax=Ornithinimicrobium cryptoxanthini TaxID=2934161 RepID=A0ABY4YIH2_9MICO|nr:hypothetical protein [Ornithinimicrobium cryptoxanthini]USQ76326.1 hypothetical protein NF557_17345 [Ornithinimicrobium cryptoxanthini]